MSKYPNTDDDEFHKKINKIYKKYRIEKNRKRNLESICFPKKFELQLPQIFLSKFISPDTPYKGILVYHRIGAGKTCTAVQIGEKWKHLRKIIVVVPASLKGNFRNELRSLCAKNSYLSESDRKKLSEYHPTSKEYKTIIEKSDKEINKYYNIYSYNKFVEYINSNTLDKLKTWLKGSVLIIDEIQNMISEGGSYYNSLYALLEVAPKSLRVILLSATPMFDKPNEIALTMNLLIPNKLPIGTDFDKKFIKIKYNEETEKTTIKCKKLDEFKKVIRGFVSYFRGAPPYIFPEMTIKYVKCEMSSFQYNAYKSVLKHEKDNVLTNNKKKVKILESTLVSELPNNFFIGTRVVSNIVFPNKNINESGFNSLKDDNVKEHLDKYSIKFHKIITKVNKIKGKVFVYSGFREYGGIKSFARILDIFGYKDYAKHGEGKKRYAIWSGDENINFKEEIRNVYNNKNNLDGQKLKILLGSPSIKEGVSLLAVRQVHILEPYWNKSRIDQVIGRASRFCSHKDIEEEKRNVKIYIYIAVHPDEKETVDEYINYLSIQKSKIIAEFEKAIKESAIDCENNKNANVFEGENDIICDI